ncbi:unnamed protein product [Lactuca saligna]|uniref:beta-galactosidase n=1 Tax=Lactuca saligna TaxID=75948 RepID=A0AA35ZZ19_LACSI|nr:unnamed protein product [Lactuca saligna]
MSSPSPLHPYHPATQNLEVIQWRSERYYRRRVPSTNTNKRSPPPSFVVAADLHHQLESSAVLYPQSTSNSLHILLPLDVANLIFSFHIQRRILISGSIHYPRSTLEAAIQGFTQKIVGMLKAENLFESQGGPIILSQIENEYGVQGKSFGAAIKAYINWAVKMAVELNIGVPMWSHQP